MNWLVSQDHRLSDLPIDASKLEGKNTLPPGAIMMQGRPIIYVGDAEGDLKNKRGWYLYVWGAVLYDDGFGGDDRGTRFCYRYNCINLDTIMVNMGPAQFIGADEVLFTAARVVKGI